jgi:hypothetical protein
MPTKKKAAITRRDPRAKQAMTDVKNALKAHKKLKLELTKVEKHLSEISAYHYGFPYGPVCGE